MKIHSFLLEQCQPESQSHRKYIENGTFEKFGFFFCIQDMIRISAKIHLLGRPYPHKNFHKDTLISLELPVLTPKAHVC